MLETDSIQSYIFATNKLKEIRGASAIIDRLNLEDTPTLIHKHFPRNNLNNELGIDETIRFADFDKLDAWVVSLGGGATRILVPQSNTAAANNFLAEVTELCKKVSSAGATSTHAIVEQRDQETDKVFLERAEATLRYLKQNKLVLSQSASNPFHKVCDSSGSVWAGLYIESEDTFISRQTAAKRARSARGLYFEQFAAHTQRSEKAPNLITDYLVAAHSERDRFVPDDLNAIGDLSTPSGYIALIYADGNRMGWRLQNHFTSFEQISEFSEKIRRGTRTALFDALLPLIEMQTAYFPFEVFFVGGDDILLAMPVQHANDFAVDFGEKFKTNTSYMTGASVRTCVSLGVGIVFAHANHPVRQLIDIAKDLASAAKVESQKAFIQSGMTAEENYFNFVVNKGSTIRDYADMCESELMYDDIVRSESKSIILHKRPYSQVAFYELLVTIRALKQARMPRSKIAQMYRALYSGWAQGTLDCLRIADRLPQRARDVLMRRFNEINQYPWHHNADGQYETPIVDWIELYDFVQEQR
ncbi:MAG: hypothetical protein ACE5IR_12915 [bacterium]